LADPRSVIRGGGHGDEGFREVTPSPEARAKGFGNFGVAFFAKTVDSILSEQPSKINKTVHTTFACCRCKCKLHEYGEKQSRPIIVVLTAILYTHLFTFYIKFIFKI